MMTIARLRPWRAFRRRLAGDTGGVAMLEFALSLPVVLAIGLYGVETANLALVNLRISQIATNLADNASRVGEMNSNNTKQLREVDINDVLAAARLQGEALQLTTRGRITISSLERSSPTSQYLHWQRCLGLKRGAGYDSGYDQTYGTMDRDDGAGLNAWNAGVSQPGGMGDATARVNAPVGSAVMYIEVSYDYKPVVSASWLPGGSARIRYTASYVVRDRRDFAKIYNPQPAAAQYFCDAYSAA